MLRWEVFVSGQVALALALCPFRKNLRSIQLPGERTLSNMDVKKKEKFRENSATFGATFPVRETACQTPPNSKIPQISFISKFCLPKAGLRSSFPSKKNLFPFKLSTSSFQLSRQRNPASLSAIKPRRHRKVLSPSHASLIIILY